MIKEFKNWFEFNPPFAASLEDWTKFRVRFKAEAPIRYYLNRIVVFFAYRVKNKIRDVKWWVKHRTTDKYHFIDTGMVPGYYDADTRMLHGVFSLLKDFIEIECAHMYRICYPWRSRVMDKKRCGIEHLKGMIKANEIEKPEYKRATQALLSAYNYWTVSRPKLVQEIDDFQASRLGIDDNSVMELYEKESSLYKSDTLHLRKITKHRKYMWT